MRVTTAFNNLLGLPGASVSDVCCSAEAVVVSVRLRRRRRVCAGCGQTGPQLEIHDRRVKRWRHLDLGASRCIIESELRRLRCRDCRTVRLEPVPWARPGAAHTRDFEDVVAWLAQQMAKTPIAGLLRNRGARHDPPPPRRHRRRHPHRALQRPPRRLNSRIRLISHRSFGFHSAAPLIALVYLCCAGVTIDLPR